MSLFNNKTNAERLAEARLQARQRLVWERRYRPRFEFELKLTADEAAKGYETGETQGALISIENHRSRVNDILSEMYIPILTQNSTRVIQETRAMKSFQGAFEELMRQWLISYALKESKLIASTTQSSVLAVIQANQGKATPEIGKAIQEILGEGNIPRFRANAIAATEIHSAAQSSSITAVRNVGLDEVKKKWATLPTRARKTHIAADGTTIEENEMFKVGKATLDHPGDQANGRGHPEELVNCNCALTYEFL